MAKGRIKRVYECVQIKSRTRPVVKFVKVDEIGNDDKPTGKKVLQRVEETETIKGGWMVYFPQKHSIFVDSRSELERLGINPEYSGCVDMETGEPVEADNVVSLRARVEQAEIVNRPIADAVDSAVNE